MALTSTTPVDFAATLSAVEAALWAADMTKAMRLSEEAVGAGADPGSMRVVETHTSATTSRALVVVGCIALGVAIAIIMPYVLLG